MILKLITQEKFKIFSKTYTTCAALDTKLTDGMKSITMYFDFIYYV